jgi:uncharacterized protein (TIGR02996 family)
MLMSDHAGFLKAICDSPDDDVPRLVYADWLDEQGQAARAEFIRVQLALAPLEGTWGEGWAKLEARENQILLEHRDEFLAPLLALGLPEVINRFRDREQHGFDFTFRRGFVEAIEVFGPDAIKQLVEVAEQLFALTPVRDLHVSSHGLLDDVYWAADPLGVMGPVTVAKLAWLPQVGRLRTLHLSRLLPGDEAADALIRSPHLTGRTRLLLTGADFSGQTWQRLRDRFGDNVSTRAFSTPYFAEDSDLPPEALDEPPDEDHFHFTDDIPF